MFLKNIGNAAKSCRMVLDSIIIQMRMGYGDRELAKRYRKIRIISTLSGSQHFSRALRLLLVEWRERIDVDFIIKANDILYDSVPKLVSSKHCRPDQNRGTLMATEICDAMVALQYIRFLQDVFLLNEDPMLIPNVFL